jgi:hypothetical protein
MAMQPSGTMIQFEGGGSTPVQYWVVIDGTEYFVYYRFGLLQVYASDDGPVGFTTDEIRVDVKIGDDLDGYWNARETNVYLQLVSDSIHSGKFDVLEFPEKSAARAHRYYRLGPLPRYAVGLNCGITERPPPIENPRMNRHDRRKRLLKGIHDHDMRCNVAVAAQDVANWISEHPAEHEAFKNLYPVIWNSVARDLELA